MAARFAIGASLLAVGLLLLVAVWKPVVQVSDPVRIRDLRIVPAVAAVCLEWTSDRPVTTAIRLYEGTGPGRDLRGDDELRRRHRMVLKALDPDRSVRFQVLAHGQPCGREEQFRPARSIALTKFRIVDEEGGSALLWETNPPSTCELAYRMKEESLSCPASAELGEKHRFVPPRWEGLTALEDFVVTARDAVGRRQVFPPRTVPGLAGRWGKAMEDIGARVFLDSLVTDLLGATPMPRVRERLRRFGLRTLLDRLLPRLDGLWVEDGAWKLYDSLVELRLAEQLAHHRRIRAFVELQRAIDPFVAERDEPFFGKDEAAELYRLHFPRWQDVFFPANLSDRAMRRAEDTVALMLPVERTTRRGHRFVFHVDEEKLARAREGQIHLLGYQFYTNYYYLFRNDRGQRLVLTNPHRDDDVPIQVRLNPVTAEPGLNTLRKRWIRFPASYFHGGRNEVEMTLLALGPPGSLLSTVQDLVVSMR